MAGDLAKAGLDVIGVETELVGGECPYWAGVPTTMMVRAAEVLAEADRVTGLAGRAEVTPDRAPVAARIREEATDEWSDQVAVDRFTGHGGRFVRGRGTLAGPGTVDVGGQVYEARRGIVVATGSRPVIPPVPGLKDTPFWTNREAVQTQAPPDSLLVMGGGAIEPSLGLHTAAGFRAIGRRERVGCHRSARMLRRASHRATKLHRRLLSGAECGGAASLMERHCIAHRHHFSPGCQRYSLLRHQK